MNTFNVYAFTIIFFSINKYSGPYIVPVVMNRSPKGMVSYQCIFFSMKIILPLEFHQKCKPDIYIYQKFAALSDTLL